MYVTKSDIKELKKSYDEEYSRLCNLDYRVPREQIRLVILDCAGLICNKLMGRIGSGLVATTELTKFLNNMDWQHFSYSGKGFIELEDKFKEIVPKTELKDRLFLLDTQALFLGKAAREVADYFEED